ncbi:MAG: hypothetical protein ACR2PM_20065, partial [Hyphomicrobiales bacterium]
RMGLFQLAGLAQLVGLGQLDMRRRHGVGGLGCGLLGALFRAPPLLPIPGVHLAVFALGSEFTWCVIGRPEIRR